MALSRKVGTFVLNSATGNQTIDTGLGVDLKVVLFWGTTQDTEGFAVSVQGFFGMAVSSTQRTSIRGRVARAAVLRTRCSARS